ncbi:hypothetical protein POM88_010359 [Heracleum sosnowskyi]|uniref:Glycoside hydrolase family 3 C-terminal domain-containing protein n=1 Tax=Heracleum sosnowskyi TaxID=360622 RepID=A0AAD8IUI9_9APIA|nr:hypothetical protein POM88_010359 [Heracleum sosnowskyi]
MDVNCGSYLQNYTRSAVMKKKLPVSQIDRALRNLFTVRMRLGLFNGNPKNLIYRNILVLPVILVLLCGGPVDVSFAKYNPKMGGILWAGYPGEAGGTALPEIIFGDHNPVIR